MLDDEGRVIWEPEAIISIRERKVRSRTLKEYLVKWNNFPNEDASWETNNFVNNIRPYPCFEDKAF